MLSSSVWRPDCRLKPSRRERRLRLILILLTAVGLLASHAPWPWPWLLAAALLHAVLARQLWCSPSSWQRVASFRATPLGWRLLLPDGELVFAEISGSVRDWPGLLCLCFRECAEDVPPGRRRRSWHLVLWSDQLPAQDWRRLRVSLRWRRRDAEAVRTPAPDRTDPRPAPARCPRSPG